MTKNQIEYWKMQEDKRHHLQDESVNRDTLTETKRMNTLTGLHYERSDAINAVNAKTNMRNATVNAVNARTNMANSRINAFNARSNRLNAQTNAYQAKEQHRHNLRTESQTDTDLSRRESEYAETVRSHQANESINTVSNEISKRNADINEYNAFTNRMNADTNARNAEIYGYEAETGRMNARINERNASTNERNVDINAINATTNQRNAESNAMNAQSNLRNAATNQYNAETNRIDTNSLVEQRSHQNALTDANVTNTQADTSLKKQQGDKVTQESELLKKQNKTYYYNTTLNWMNDTIGMSSEATRDLTGAGRNILTSVFSLLK